MYAYVLIPTGYVCTKEICVKERGLLELDREPSENIPWIVVRDNEAH